MPEHSMHTIIPKFVDSQVASGKNIFLDKFAGRREKANELNKIINTNKNLARTNKRFYLVYLV